ncbi:host specificity protein (tail fiber protein) [Enterobacteria phage phi80]|nr:tail protein [Enterobacteria phage phi80]AFV29161.1 host specificity protein (tail fiber protein) [Enterobacteria phage phi80]
MTKKLVITKTCNKTPSLILTNNPAQAGFFNGVKMQLLHGETIIQGAKGGGGSAHTPVEQPDDLLSVAKLKMLIAVSEGEIQGDLTAQNIFLNDTPLANDSGEYNFSGVKWEFRKGTQDQTYIAGMPQVDNELAVGTTVTTTAPWTRQFTNLSLDAIRIKLSLPVQYLYKDNGDMVGTVTEYAIDLSTDGGAWKTVVNGKFDGKTTTEYQRDHRIDLPKSTSGWSVRVRRITADASGSNSKLVNAFKVFSYAEVIDSKLRYPLTALLYVEVDSSQFNGSAPKVTCKIKGKLIKVPDNYDPITRTYSGSWSGGFKMAWSNNPAWIFYDLVLDEIYGMGTRVDASMVDKWALYSIAQYCDEMVSDGAGGTEPRFTCNVFIQSQEDAWQVLNDLAAVFRGITFWGNDQIYVQADVPQDDVDWVYNASNVIDGLFTYAGGSYKNRYSSCLVSWSDPQNHYSDTVEGVYDSALVERYDVRQTSLTAIGCTSQSEAHRRGRWVLLSNAKDGTVSFGVGLDGYIPLPAEIIGVADPFRSGKENGGRIRAVNGRQITLDREIDYAAKDRLVVNLPDGKAQTRTISAVSADKKTVTVATAFSQAPVAGAVWAIDSDNLAIQYFRVTSIAANDDSTGGFTITAVQHDPNKYRYIDDGVRVESPPITVTPISVLSAPKNIVVTESDHVSQGLTVASLDVSWDKVEGAIRYVAQWRKDNGDWINVPVTSAQGFSVQGIYSGSYDVRVRALNAQDTSSPWGYGETTYLSGKTGKPGTPLNFLATEDVVWHIDLTWKFPDGSGDTAYTEIQRATTADYANPELLVLVPYPAADYQHGPMPAGVRQWYRARLIDRIGNAGDWTDWIMGTSSIDVSEITNDILEDMKESETFKDLIENAVDSNEKIAGMADEIKNHADELEQQAKDIQENADGLAQAAVKIDEISVSMDGMTGGVKNSAIAIIQNGLAQVVSRRSQTATNAGNSASIDRVDTTIADTSQAVARALVTLDASAGGNISNSTDLTETLADFTQASATKINTLTVKSGENSAAINVNAQAIADVNGNLSAMYNIKVGVSSNGQYYAAGMGIGVENTPSGMQSQVIFLADRFAVTTAAGNSVALPFVIQNGQTFIRASFIQDGTISNAKIGNFIQSNNYVAGSAGWKLDKGGTFENYGSTAGEGAMKLTNQTISVKDGSNVLRVQVGRLTGVF